MSGFSINSQWNHCEWAQTLNLKNSKSYIKPQDGLRLDTSLSVLSLVWCSAFHPYIAEHVWYKTKQYSEPQYPRMLWRWLSSPICGKELLGFILKTEGEWEKYYLHALCEIFQGDGPDLQLCPCLNKPTFCLCCCLLFWDSFIQIQNIIWRG